MEETSRQSWILKDVDIEIRIKSGDTDLSTLRQLLNALMGHLLEPGVTGAQITVHEEKITSTPKRSLRVISRTLRIE